MVFWYNMMKPCGYKVSKKYKSFVYIFSRKSRSNSRYFMGYVGSSLKIYKNASPWWKAAAILVSFGACVLPSIE
jgi:hypothetical protein